MADVKRYIDSQDIAGAIIALQTEFNEEVAAEPEDEVEVNIYLDDADITAALNALLVGLDEDERGHIDSQDVPGVIAEIAELINDAQE